MRGARVRWHFLSHELGDDSLLFTLRFEQLISFIENKEYISFKSFV